MVVSRPPATKPYLITGASSGIGLCVAERLVNAGMQVVVVGRNLQPLEDLRDKAVTNQVSVVRADLSEPEESKSVASTLDRPLAGIVHCAGIDQKKPVHLLKAEQVHRLLEVNTLSLLWLSEHLHHRGLLANGCSVVAVSSVLATRSVFGAVAYSLSKAGLEAMVRSLALEWAPQGIRVNCVRAGTVTSPMTERLFSKISEDGKDEIIGRHPLGLGSVDNVADSVMFLLSDQASWITGTALTVDGGYSIC